MLVHIFVDEALKLMYNQQEICMTERLMVEHGNIHVDPHLCWVSVRGVGEYLVRL